jgi:hypothetical protein
MRQRDVADPAVLNCDRMGPDELHSEMAKLAEAFAGPMDRFATVEDFLEALRARMAVFGADSRDMTDVIRRHWARLHWFEDHASHGEPVLMRGEGWLGEVIPLGRRLIFRCPCGDNPALQPCGSGVLDTREAFVPERFRTMKPLEPSS